MKLYLAGVNTKCDADVMKRFGCKFMLVTFYGLKRMKTELREYILSIPTDDLILDSGVFTFMNGGERVHWKTYVNEYCDFINKYDIKQFIELDLYGILGVEKTEKIRRYIEHKTNKKPIPVYHGTLPVSYFRMLCENYPYVAISATGTIESSKWTKNTRALKQIVKIGHSYGTKLHGLGYTRLSNLNNTEVMFDSVDSTAWLSGARFGIWYTISHGDIKRRNLANKGITRQQFDDNNSKVWIKKQNMLYKN